MIYFWRATVCINIYERIYFPSFHQVQDEEISCPFCSKKCKSDGGLKRQVTCKHKDERENGPETDEGEESKFTNELFAKMVEQFKCRLINNKVFSKDIREELSAYQFTNLYYQKNRWNSLN